MEKHRHEIHTGAFAALETKWLENVAELQRHDPLAEIAVLVGSNILATYLKRRLAESGRIAANIRFYNFPALIGRIVGSAPSDPPRFPPRGPLILLETLLEDRTSLPEAYRPLAGYKGFRDAVLETFRDLRDAGITPDRLDQVVRAGKRAGEQRQHLADFSWLYRRYRSEVARFHDVDDDFRTVVARLSQSSETAQNPPLSGCSCLLVYGIYDATEQQAQLLDTLSRALPLIYFIPFVGEEVSTFAQPFLEARAATLGVVPQRVAVPESNTVLGGLARRNFGFSSRTTYGDALAVDGTVRLISAPGESHVAIEVVREILQAVRDGSIRGFHEAVVILRRPEADIPLLTEAMRLRGIPYFIHGGARFLERPLAKAVQALIGLNANSFAREAILTAMEFIAAALPKGQGDEAGKWNVADWRRLTNDARFLMGVHAWDGATRAILCRMAGEVRQLKSQSVNEAEEDSGSEKLAAAISRRNSARWLRRAWRLVRAAAADWPESLSFNEWAQFIEKRFGRILKTAPDWPRFQAALDEIATLQTLAQPGNQNKKYEKCPAAKLRTVLNELLGTLTCPAGRFQRDGVNLLSVSAARGLRFPLVIIPGLDEGCFPSKLRQDPLLPDAERRRLGNLPLRGERVGEEKLLFDMAARSAWQRLVLITSRLDEGADREKIPSQFFLRAATAVSGGRITIRDLNFGNVPCFRSVSLDEPAPAPGVTAVDEGEIRLRWITGKNRSAEHALEALARLESVRIARPLEYSHSRWINRLTKFDGRISDSGLVRMIGEKLEASSEQVSASRFEEYAKCPYSFLLKRVFELQAWVEDDGMMEGMNPLERGTAIHAILESFLRNCVNGSFASATGERLWISLEQTACRELERWRPKGMPALLWEIELGRLLEMLRNWLEFEIDRAEDDMRMAHLEQPFGTFSEEESLPPFQMSIEGFDLAFRGRIDRVDLSHDGTRARVVDYKTGVLPASMNKKDRPILMGGEKIQLAIYRGALTVLAGFEKLTSVTAEYLHLQPRDGKILPSVLTPEKLNEAFAALPRVLQIINDGMKSGLFFARTSGAVHPYGHCDYCDYLPICGKDRLQREQRKNADPVMQPFAELLETAELAE